MNLIKYRFLFLVVTLASQLGFSETLGLIEVGKDASEIRNQFVIFRQTKNKNSEKDVVVFSICTDPQRTFSRRCAENPLKTSLDTNAYLAALTPVFNLQNYERLRQRFADQEESARRYRTQAGLAPESERAQIESDLQKGLQQIAKTQTDLQDIRASHTGYPTYHRILTALNVGEEGDETIPIFSSSNRTLFYGAITPFATWFRENICTCSPMQGNENVCLLRRNGNVLAWMRSENGCATRNACLRGTWFAGSGPSTTPARLNFDDLLNTQCGGYLNVGLTLLQPPATVIAAIPTQAVPPVTTPRPMPPPTPSPIATPSAPIRQGQNAVSCSITCQQRSHATCTRESGGVYSVGTLAPNECYFPPNGYDYRNGATGSFSSEAEARNWANRLCSGEPILTNRQFFRTQALNGRCCNVGETWKYYCTLSNPTLACGERE